MQLPVCGGGWHRLTRADGCGRAACVSAALCTKIDVVSKANEKKVGGAEGTFGGVSGSIGCAGIARILAACFSLAILHKNSIFFDAGGGIGR